MYKLSRDEFRKIKSMTKENMERWLSQKNAIIYQTLRKEFESNFKDELQCSIDCFIAAMSYTLYFSEETKMDNDKLSRFLEDMFVTVDYFRTGEYKPEEYLEALSKEGIKLRVYDYSRIYKEKITKMEEEFNAKMQKTLPQQGEVSSIQSKV